jgi:hypothetical protein
MPAACVQKKYSEPDSRRGSPAPISPETWIMPESRKVTNKTAYRDISVFLGSRIAEQAMKSAMRLQNLLNS